MIRETDVKYLDRYKDKLWNIQQDLNELYRSMYNSSILDSLSEEKCDLYNIILVEIRNINLYKILEQINELFDMKKKPQILNKVNLCKECEKCLHSFEYVGSNHNDDIYRCTKCNCYEYR